MFFSPRYPVHDDDNDRNENSKLTFIEPFLYARSCFKHFIISLTPLSNHRNY